MTTKIHLTWLCRSHTLGNIRHVLQCKLQSCKSKMSHGNFRYVRQLAHFVTTGKKKNLHEKTMIFAVLTSMQEVWMNFGNFQHSVLPDSCISKEQVSKIKNEVCTRRGRKQMSLNEPPDVCRDNIVNNMMISWVQSISYWSRNHWTEQCISLSPEKWVSSGQIMPVK